MAEFNLSTCKSEINRQGFILTPLFGPNWIEQKTEFLASDDRVRGGSSQSHLDIQSDSDGEYALFHGLLDTKTLGGAGFASQKTADTSKVWDLSESDGIYLDIRKTDGKRYTLTISNEIAEKRPDGRDRSTLLYEYSFHTDYTGPLKRYVKWAEFKPFYRGKPKEDAPKLDTANIRRWSFMIRSFFDKQHGEFSMCMNCVCAFQTTGEKRETRNAGEKG